MKLTVAVATRGRPKTLIPTVREFEALSQLDDTRIVILADHDDPETGEAVIKAGFGPKVIFSPAQREDTLGEKYNRVLEIAPADVYQVAVDYHLIKTKGYDKKVLEAAALFPDGIGCVYGPPANASFPSIQAPTAKLVELLGGIYPPHFPFWFVDHWLDDLMLATGRIINAEIEVDCQTQRSGETTELRDVAFWAEFYEMGMLERRAQVEKLVAAMDEPDWRKTAILTGRVRVEARSAYINGHVAADHKAIEAARGAKASDERYVRIKAKAEKLLPIWKANVQSFFSAGILKDQVQQNPKEFAWLLRHVKGFKSILEVGSCHGNSLASFAVFADSGAKLRSVDIGTLPGTKEALAGTIEELKTKGFDADVLFADSHSLQAVKWAEANGPYDLVFIDGDHTYEGVRQDWVNYGSMGKIVVFHDIAHPNLEVRRFWAELESSGVKTAKRVDDTGIGVVFQALSAA